MPQTFSVCRCCPFLPCWERDWKRSARRRVCLGADTLSEGELAPNLRQADRLRQALAALGELESAIAASVPPDLCAIHLETASALLADITGLNTTEETLNSIFASFCIGK